MCWLLKPASPERIDEAADAGFAMVGVDAGELTETLVRRAHARGLEIRAYGVETDAEIEHALRDGLQRHDDRPAAAARRPLAGATARPPLSARRGREPERAGVACRRRARASHPDPGAAGRLCS